jgi:hypothetical protein
MTYSGRGKWSRRSCAQGFIDQRNIADRICTMADVLEECATRPEDYDIALCDASESAEAWAVERIESRGEDATDEAVETEIQAYADDWYAEEEIQQWKFERHVADVRRLRLTGTWRVNTPLICRPRMRARSSRSSRSRRVRRGARTVSSRGDPDEPEPPGGRRPCEPAERAAA